MSRRASKRKLVQSNLIDAFKKQRTNSSDMAHQTKANDSKNDNVSKDLQKEAERDTEESKIDGKKAVDDQSVEEHSSNAAPKRLIEEKDESGEGCSNQQDHVLEDKPSSPKTKKQTEKEEDVSLQENPTITEKTNTGDSQTSNVSATFENPDSPDLFDDSEPMEDLPGASLQETQAEVDEGPSVGVPKEKLNSNPACASLLPELRNTPSCKVLFKVTHNMGAEIPSPSRNQYLDRWDQDHVRMPCSPENMYPIEKGTRKDLAKRWEVIETSLLQDIKSSWDLEKAILSYNTRYSRRWDFSALHSLLNEEFTVEEQRAFFKDTLPKMVELTLQLQSICPEPIPLLRKQALKSIQLSQKQAACLLANAFFCTFPRRNTRQKESEYSNFPEINFNGLFMGGGSMGAVSPRKLEKLKCILHYFTRVTKEMPKGTLSYRRQLIRDFPDWRRSVTELGELHICGTGTIEDDGIGMLQVDFANKYIGGGVLGRGCVQEEIRFLICPEMILSRLFTEVLDKNECLIMTGCERFSNYTGYADSFQWDTNHIDPTPRDAWGRLYTEVVAIDALVFRSYPDQFDEYYVNRELNKAYCGFLSPGLQKNNLSAVATGNWGCGAFGGDLRLKALIQIMAASEAKRDVCYFTFGDYGLRDEVHKIHQFIKEKQLAIGDIWALIGQYSNVCRVTRKKNLYEYIYSVYNSYDDDTDEDMNEDSRGGSDVSREMLHAQDSPDYAANTP